MKTAIKKVLMALLIFSTIAGAYFYYTTDYIIIRFDELGPLTKNMSAYYNGFKIGKIVRISPNKDFSHTLATVKLLYKDINLPQNTKVYLQSFPNGELYLQFVYPDSPSFKTIKRGDLIEGITPYNIEKFMLGQNISGMSDIVSLHVIKALNATEIANHEMTQFFKNTSKLINENRKAITASVNNTEATTKSLAQMAENLNQATKKINNALDEKNLQDTTLNIKETTENISEATKDIDKTIKKIDDTIIQTNAAAENLNSMTSGLNQALSKRFAGMRILFGTPVKQEKCEKNLCK